LERPRAEQPRAKQPRGEQPRVEEQSVEQQGVRFLKPQSPVAKSSEPPRAVVKGQTYSAERNTSATLTLRTDDGDTVSLTFESASRLESARVRGGGVEASETLREESYSLSLSAQGDLDAEELADISKLVRKLAAGVRDVERGRPERAAERLLRGEYDSLASYGVEIQSEVTTERSRFSLLA
jgi:hypothetical protein